MATLIPQLQSLLDTDVSSITSDSAARRQALDLVRALRTKLESPMDTGLRITWSEPANNMALTVLLDLQIPDFLSTASASLKSIPEIARFSGADPNLLRRLLRHLAAMGAVRESQRGDDQETLSYGSTVLTEGLRKKEVAGSVEHWFDVQAPNFLSLPRFLQETGYKDPVDPRGNWLLAKHTDKVFFEWMNANPEMLERFGSFMKGYTDGRGSWLDVYDVQERVAEGAEEEGPLIVDVGGSMGHDMEGFQAKYPQPAEKGRLIVQDQPLVLAEAEGKVDVAITLMPHDFFTPQPVKGARVYYLHSVLHDWPDDKCLEILGNLKPAFKKGYSKLVLNESVIPTVGANPQVSGLDLVLMGVFGGRERNREDWERLLKDAGFKIIGIWGGPAAYESVIEAELVED